VQQNQLTASLFKQMPNHFKVRALLWISAIKKFYNKRMKGKALRKHSLHEKTAALILLKLFISGTLHDP